MAEFAQSEELKASFLRLEASWLRLAEAAEKAEEPEDPAPPPPDGSTNSASPSSSARPN